jgi:hypothetical protein
MAEEPTNLSFTPGSSFIKPDSGYAHNDEVLDSAIAGVSDEMMEDIIQRGKGIGEAPPVVAVKQDEAAEESPTTPKASNHPAQPHAALKGKGSMPLTSEIRAQIRKRREEKEKEKTEESKLAEPAPPPQEPALNEPAPLQKGKEKEKKAVSTESRTPDSKGEEWEDSLEVASHDPRHAEGEEEGMYGMTNPLLSVSSTQAADLRKDVEDINLRVDQVTVKEQTLEAQLQLIMKNIDEIKIANNQFQSDLTNRIRRLERTLDHDRPITMSSKEMADKKIPSGSVSSGAPATKAEERGAPVEARLSFAERMRRRREQSEQ